MRLLHLLFREADSIPIKTSAVRLNIPSLCLSLLQEQGRRWNIWTEFMLNRLKDGMVGLWFLI
nr:MAG TPA: hypothetical protein [Caudoviricetes sp.]